MATPHLAMLLALAAIWGASFMFMRISAPAFGPVALVELRVLVGALVLAPFVWGALRRADPKPYLGKLLVLGALNTALPFALFAYATLTLPAAATSIINGTMPLWGFAIAALFGLEPLSPLRTAGLVLGVAGIAVVTGDPQLSGTPEALRALGAGILAAILYGIAANYARVAFEGVEPTAVALGGQLGAALTLLPALPFLMPQAMPSPGAWAAALTLGALCTGAAYALYFRLIASVGAAKAMTVAFLIPVFGVLWGWLFLGETITARMLLGCAIVLVGTALSVELRVVWPRWLAPRAAAGA
jgi:drug/metabolite transporter (DMT)-like permease